ncbi:MAG: ribonucleoside-diphosphate reductase subunit alpha [Legionellales bacterium]|nr:ribonucleoside-diphosphate reductase subunit alpha [Legionellales bacterium]
METIQKEQTMNRNNQKKSFLLQEPGKLYVIRRNGDLVEYNAEKIIVAVTNAFLAVEGAQAQSSDRIHETVNILVNQLTATFKRRLNNGGIIHIEDIQDQVELALMRTGEHKVARAYVLYREERRKAREAQMKNPESDSNQRLLHITLHDGLRVPLDMGRVSKIVQDACQGLTDVNAHDILKDVERNLFDGLTMKDLQKALVLSARTLIESEPNYTYVAARILMDELRSDALMFLELGQQATAGEMAERYPVYFTQYLNQGVKVGRLTPDLLKFDIPRLAAALKPERDNQLTYLGLQTLYDRYFIHEAGHRFELPQAFFMRVAMGLALNETDKEARTIEFYDLLSSFDYMTSTPTLFNSGTLRPQLSSCYLSTIPDNLEGIYSAIKDNALLSKYAGGLGNDWTPVRAMGADIKGTNGQSLGPIPFMVVANATLVAVNQGGKRKGAGCAYLETFHRSIKEFLELRKNTGDERRRTHDMNTANWIPDLFMKRVMENGEWTLFSPDETPDLHDLYGKAFEEAYINYEIKAGQGKIRNIETMPAVNLWRRMLGMLFETGHPWVTFKDPCNLRSPQQHAGVVHSSNLCTEITLNTSEDEIAVCNLGSINLPAHINAQGELDKAKLERTINTAMRMLDNVIDINYYSVPQARRSNLKHRPVGLGIMGFQDALYKLGIDYASDAAVLFADRSMEQISYFAIQASAHLAEERGVYSSYEGSLWSKGILPIDSIDLLEQARGKQYLEQDRSQTLDWESLRKRIKIVGMRNSNTMAIAPTATISNIIGVSQSIEPTYQNLFVKSNLSGEFTVINPYLVNDLKRLGLWDAVMINDLKYYNGSVASIGRVPAALKQRYATAFEIDPVWLIEAGSRRQKWIDQAQSLNLYMAEPSGKKLDSLYKLAWIRGLKTTYYLRSMGASNAEKSTIHDGALNAVSMTSDASSEGAAAPKTCSIEDPDCEACQ